MSGTSAHGQGHATSFSMIVADRLGIPLDRITYRQSDTAIVRTGGGTGGSRSLQLGGNAVSKAADELREKAIAVAARMLEANAEDVTLDDEGFGVAGVPGSHVSWPELAAYAHEHDGGLGVDTDFTQKGATFPFGAHVAIVEVDLETGQAKPVRHVAVDDCGRIVNPLIVAGQQHGGAIQGISQALWEEMVYDEQGTPITSSFADYAIPTAADAHHARGLQHRDADPGEPDRRQGHRRVRDDRLDARGAERRRRRAQAPRRQAHRPAVHARAGLARDPEPAGRRVARAAGGVRPARERRRASPTSSRPRATRPAFAATRSYTWGVSAPVSPAAGAAGPAVEIDGLVMRYGDKVAVDGLSLTVERASITAVLGPNGAGKTTTLETAEGYRSPQEGRVRVLGPRPGARPSCAAPPDRRDAPARRRVERRARRRDAAAHRPAARPPARRRRALRPARPRRLRAYAVPPALRRPAAAARAGDGDRRPPRDRVRRRADGRHGPGGTAYDVGAAPGAPRGGGHRRADDALHGGGRAPRRPDPHHRPRPADRQRARRSSSPAAAARRRSGWSSPSRSRPTHPSRCAPRSVRRSRSRCSTR